MSDQTITFYDNLSGSWVQDPNPNIIIGSSSGSADIKLNGKSVKDRIDFCDSKAVQYLADADCSCDMAVSIDTRIADHIAALFDNFNPCDPTAPLTANLCARPNLDVSVGAIQGFFANLTAQILCPSSIGSGQQTCEFSAAIEEKILIFANNLLEQAKCYSGGNTPNPPCSSDTVALRTLADTLKNFIRTEVLGKNLKALNEMVKGVVDAACTGSLSTISLALPCATPDDNALVNQLAGELHTHLGEYADKLKSALSGGSGCISLTNFLSSLISQGIFISGNGCSVELGFNAIKIGCGSCSMYAGTDKLLLQCAGNSVLANYDGVFLNRANGDYAGFDIKEKKLYVREATGRYFEVNTKSLYLTDGATGGAYDAYLVAGESQGGNEYGVAVQDNEGCQAGVYGDQLYSYNKATNNYAAISGCDQYLLIKNGNTDAGSYIDSASAYVKASNGSHAYLSGEYIYAANDAQTNYLIQSNKQGDAYFSVGLDGTNLSVNKESLNFNKEGDFGLTIANKCLNFWSGIAFNQVNVALSGTINVVGLGDGLGNLKPLSNGSQAYAFQGNFSGGNLQGQISGPSIKNLTINQSISGEEIAKLFPDAAVNASINPNGFTVSSPVGSAAIFINPSASFNVDISSQDAVDYLFGNNPGITSIVKGFKAKAEIGFKIIDSEGHGAILNASKQSLTLCHGDPDLDLASVVIDIPTQHGDPNGKKLGAQWRQIDLCVGGVAKQAMVLMSNIWDKDTGTIDYTI